MTAEAISAFEELSDTLGRELMVEVVGDRQWPRIPIRISIEIIFAAGTRSTSLSARSGPRTFAGDMYACQES
jgi:hypothetical protein